MTLEICPSIWKQGQWHNLHFHLLLVRQDARMTMTTTRDLFCEISDPILNVQPVACNESSGLTHTYKYIGLVFGIVNQ